MITASEIKRKAERKYVEYLRGIVVGATFEPICIICDKKASNTIAAYQREVADLCSLSKEKNDYGYTIEWKRVNTKALGVQDFPDKILFKSAEDYERFLRKVSEVSQFRKDVAMIVDNFPSLLPWIEKYPMKVIDNASVWPDLLKVLRYFSANPVPDLYIRELPIEVHTKFIEQHKAVLRELLDIVIADNVCTGETDFEKRFGLRYDEPQVRLRVLDAALVPSLLGGVDDVAMPVSRFCRLTLPVSKAFVVENKVNFLTFPSVKDSIVIWGHGYDVSFLQHSKLLKSIDLYYWGDLDAQGFEILSQFRGYFPQTRSFLMDRHTFEACFEGDSGTPSNVSVPLNLTKEELDLYEYLKSHNFRLEQEKIPQLHVLQQLPSVC